MRTQLVFKQHEIEASRRAAHKPPAPSQPAASPPIPLPDVPRSPHSHNVAAHSLSSQQPVVPPPRVSKLRPPPPGFVNEFVVAPLKNGKGKVPASVFEQNLDQPPNGSVRPPTHTQPGEAAEIYNDEVDGQAANTTFSEVDFPMDLAGDVKTSEPNAGFSKAVQPFDWVGWVCPHLPYYACSRFMF